MQRSLRRIQPSSSSNARLALRQLEVGRPATQQRVRGLDSVAQGSAARSAQQCSSACPSRAHARRRNPQLRLPVPRHAVAQELALPRPRPPRSWLALTVSLSRSPEKAVRLAHHPLSRPLDCAHRCCSRRHSGRTRGRAAPVPGRDRSAGCSTAAARAARLAACPSVSRLHHPVRHHARLQDTGGSASAPVHRRSSAPAAISTSWFTRSKNFSRSMSTTQRLPSAT